MAKNISLSSESLRGGTLIPNCFFDRFLPRASGEFIKIYLYLLRWLPVPGHSISICSIADFFDMTEKDVLRAISWWEKAGLLSVSRDDSGEITAILLADIDSIARPESSSSDDADAASSANSDAASPAGAGRARSSSGSARSPRSMEEMGELTESDDGAQLLVVLQHYLGRPISQSELGTIYYFYSELGFSLELIEYLFEYCISSEHRDMRYIEKVALAWKDAGIDSAEAAKSYLKGNSKIYYEVLKSFGLSGRMMTEEESSYCDRWSLQFGFSDEMILLACQRTMSRIHRPEFGYTQKILESWMENGAFTPEAVEALDAARKQSSKQKSSGRADAGVCGKRSAGAGKSTSPEKHGYNYKELERRLTGRKAPDENPESSASAAQKSALCS